MQIRPQSFQVRQNMEKSTFEVFHYCDPKPETVAVHHHDFYEIYFFLGGDVEYRVEGRTYILKPGDLLLINPRELHQPIVKHGSTYERIVLWIDKNYIENFGNNSASLTRCFDIQLPTHSNILRPTGIQRSKISEYLNGIITEYYGDGYGAELSANGLFLQLMVEINRLALQKGRTAEPVNDTLFITQVLSFINEHYNDELSLDSIARKFFVSKYHLSHEFRREVGTSVYRYIMLKRLLNAKELLAKGFAPGFVYHECGFQDYANFYRAFKSEYGVSPKEFGLKNQ